MGRETLFAGNLARYRMFSILRLRGLAGNSVEGEEGALAGFLECRWAVSLQILLLDLRSLVVCLSRVAVVSGGRPCGERDGRFHRDFQRDWESDQDLDKCRVGGGKGRAWSPGA
jgi:hypothetical protein